MSKICSKCGAPMDDDQNFCEVCGAKAELPVSEPEKPVKPKKGKKEEPAAPAPKPVAEKELPAPLSAVGLDVAAPVAAEVVPEPAAEPAPEPKPEPKPESKPEPAADAKPEPKPEPQKPAELPRTPVATIPVPAPPVAAVAPVTVATAKNQDVPSTLPKQFKPLRTSMFMLFMLLFSLPGIGIIALIVCSIPKSINRNIRNMARAYLWWLLIVFIILVIAALLGYFLLWPIYGPQITEIIGSFGSMLY